LYDAQKTNLFTTLTLCVLGQHLCPIHAQEFASPPTHSAKGVVASKPRPTGLIFNTAYYATAGMCQITSKGVTDGNGEALKAFALDDKTAWSDKSASSWLQRQYVDGQEKGQEHIFASGLRCGSALCRFAKRFGENAGWADGPAWDAAAA